MQVITTHVNADFDCLASMIAARKLYPEALLVFPGSQEKNVREFLKQSEIDWRFTRIKDIPLSAVTHLIIVDTRHSSRIGDFGPLSLQPGVRVHVYDHHPSLAGDIPAELEVVREVGATTTLLVEILQERKISISREEATLLALGIYEDTGSLSYTSTKPEDLKAVAYLLGQGADLALVSHHTRREMSSEQIALLHDLMAAAERHAIDGVDLVVAWARTERRVGDVAQVAHTLGDLQGAGVLLILVEMEGRIHLIARSRVVGVNVADVARGFGGGGHPTAASATLRHLTLLEARERATAMVCEQIRGVRKVREVLVAPAHTVDSKMSLAQAEELMTRFGINALPVVDREVPVGIITRQIVERAIHHGLGREKVSDLMNTEFPEVTDDTLLQDAEHLMMEGRQRLIPVVEKESRRLLGVLTRGDLLRSLYSLQTGRVFDSESPGIPGGTLNVKTIMQERLSSWVLQVLAEVSRASEHKRFGAYMVGGIVRDLLLNVKNDDLDIVVEGDGIALAAHVTEALGGRIRSHRRFGTAVLILPDKCRVDVATARTEYYAYPAALPTVEWSSIKRDLSRRDFTINALAIKIGGKDGGRLIDFFGGRRDLKDRIIRVLHNLSFIEDPTRVFRAVRFEQRYQFRLDRQTQMLLEGAIRKDLVSKLSGPRLWAELVLILQEKEPHRILQRLEELKVLASFHPSLRTTAAHQRLFVRISEICSWSRLQFPALFFESWILDLLALVDDLKESEVRQFADRLIVPPRLTEMVLLCRRHQLAIRSVLTQQDSLLPSRIDEGFRALPLEATLFLMAKDEEGDLRQAASQYLGDLRDVRPMLRGADLIGLGLEPGPQFKEILGRLREARLNGEVRSREDEEAIVRREFGTGGTRGS